MSKLPDRFIVADSIEYIMWPNLQIPPGYQLLTSGDQTPEWKVFSLFLIVV